MIKLILILVISYISLSDACSCYLPTGWQDEFYCRYNFAGTFKVVSPQYNCGNSEEELICYSIVVLDQMRGPPVTVTYAQTHIQSSMCGTTLTVGHTYFVSSGVGESNNIGVGLCMLLEDWTELSCADLNEKKRHYEQLSCGDEPTVPTTPTVPIDPECGSPATIFSLNNILGSLLKLLENLKLRSSEKSNPNPKPVKGCPAVDTTIQCIWFNEQCNESDKRCPDGSICCGDNCGTFCVDTENKCKPKPKPKPVKGCPKVDDNIQCIWFNEQCNDADKRCPAGSICCGNNCGTSCIKQKC